MTQTNGKIYHTHGLEELILLKWAHYPRQSTDSMQFPIKIWMAFFIRTNYSKIFMETQKTLNSNLVKKEQSWEYHASWFQAIL